MSSSTLSSMSPPSGSMVGSVVGNAGIDVVGESGSKIWGPSPPVVGSPKGPSPPVVGSPEGLSPSAGEVARVLAGSVGDCCSRVLRTCGLLGSRICGDRASIF